MDELLLEKDENDDPEFRAKCFGILFDEAPTYAEIDSGTPNLAQFIKLNEVFKRDQNMETVSKVAVARVSRD